MQLLNSFHVFADHDERITTKIMEQDNHVQQCLPPPPPRILVGHFNSHLSIPGHLKAPYLGKSERKRGPVGRKNQQGGLKAWNRLMNQERTW